MASTSRDQVEDSDRAQDLLRLSLAEAQATVRAYDTKAQIVGIGYIFGLGVIGRFESAMPSIAEADIAYVLSAWAVAMLPIVLFGAVLYPTRKIAPRLNVPPARTVRGVLYVEPGKIGAVETLKDAARTCDPETELAHELLKVSGLRELKRKRFLRALFSAAASFAFIFVAQVLRVG